jgi:hypothetical protein
VVQQHPHGDLPVQRIIGEIFVGRILCLILWDKNFYSKKVGGETLVRELESHGLLNKWFSDLTGNPIVFKSVNNTMTATLTLQAETFFSGARVPHIDVSESALSGFTGEYHGAELEATYNLSLANGTLTLRNGDQPPVNLNPVAANEFESGDIGTIVFQVAGNSHVSGRTVFSQRARGITFQKTD